MKLSLLPRDIMAHICSFLDADQLFLLVHCNDTIRYLFRHKNTSRFTDLTEIRLRPFSAQQEGHPLRPRDLFASPGPTLSKWFPRKVALFISGISNGHIDYVFNMKIDPPVGSFAWSMLRAIIVQSCYRKPEAARIIKSVSNIVDEENLHVAEMPGLLIAVSEAVVEMVSLRNSSTAAQVLFRPIYNPDILTLILMAAKFRQKYTSTPVLQYVRSQYEKLSYPIFFTHLDDARLRNVWRAKLNVMEGYNSFTVWLSLFWPGHPSELDAWLLSLSSDAM